MANIEVEYTISTERFTPSTELPDVDTEVEDSYEMALALGKISPEQYEYTLPREYRLPIPKNQI